MHAHRATKCHGKTTDGLVLGPVLGLIFLCLSLLRIFGDLRSALFAGPVRIAPIESPIWQMRLGYRIVEFVGALLLVHLMLGVLAWAMAWLTRRAWLESRSSQRAWTCLWALAGMIWIFTANATWFPSSSLGSPYAGFVQTTVIAGRTVFDLLSFILAMAVVATIACFVWRHRIAMTMLMPAIAAPVSVVILCLVLVSLYPPTLRSVTNAVPAKPNIILIGLDSVRADVSDAGRNASVPALSAFLRGAAVFPDTTTPLARTFSAWVSILTGRHPHTTGAMVNLLSRDLIDTGGTLPDLLRAGGYETIYATDEVRFSNIDESYGFDRIIGPRIGSADFLIEFFGDTPLSNVLVNTRLGDALFPELHGNRAAKIVYDPDTFVRDLERNLRFDSPIFLATHLTLPHWPYTYATSETEPRETTSLSRQAELHAAALERVDRQFADLIAMLESKGALDNAVVVVLSDHGESLGETSPLADDAGEISPLLGKSSLYGHGTHVFSNDQYKVLLAIRGYGEAPVPLVGGRIPAPASLEDVTPTLLDALEIASRDAFDGRSLMPYLRAGKHGDLARAEPRIRFLETEYNPPGMAIEDRRTASAIRGAMASYKIDPLTDRIEIHREELNRILYIRQYAAVLGDQMLASVPASDRRSQHLVFASLNSGDFVWLDEPPTVDSTAIQWKLWSALRARFEPVAARPVLAVSEGDE